MAEPFSFPRIRQVADAFARHSVKYLLIGKGGAIVLGFSDTTQDIDVFLEKSDENCAAVIKALEDLGFTLAKVRRTEIHRGKDFIQIKDGPFDIDLVFAPDGIENFSDANRRALTVDGVRVCHLDDIIRSKEATGRVRDREVLPRLRAFRDWWMKRRP